MTAEARMRIGEAAAEAGVSARTLRYYQELGLLTPSATTAGGARRYSAGDVARIQRIIHLRDLVGLDLNEIGRVLAAEDRLASIKREWFEGQTERRRIELLEECTLINAEVQELVKAKMTGLSAFLATLEERADLYASRLAELRSTALTSS